MGEIRKSLFSTQIEYIRLMDKIESNEGILTDEMVDSLTISESELKVKSETYAHILDRIGVENKLVADKIKQLQAIKKANDNLGSRLKENLSSALNTFGYEKFETDSFKLSFRKSESVKIDCEIEELQSDCKVWSVSPISKTEIKKRLKSGEEIENVFLESKKNLTIKLK